jgi:hypothetical protein
LVDGGGERLIVKGRRNQDSTKKLHC